MFMNLLKLPFSHVTGYKGASKIRAAIMKNEVQLTEDSLTGYVARVKPQLIDTGVSIPLWHVGHPTADGGLRRSHTVAADIPMFLDIYQAKYGKGKRPKGLMWDAIVHIAKTREMLRSVFLPVGAPKKALAELRAAWDITMADQAYKEEYRKLNASPLIAYDGPTATKMMADAVTVKPVLQKWLLDFADKARK